MFEDINGKDGFLR